MNDPNITRQIVHGITQRRPMDIKDMSAWLLDKADKSDPFNQRAVLAIEARINGRPAAWVVETPNHGDALQRLIVGAIAEILAKPDQARSDALGNRTFV